MENPIVIVGGGLSGLLAASLLRQKYPQHPITIVENSANIGGLLHGKRYSDQRWFDHGMHFVTECGIPAVDDWLWSLLPEEEWNVLEGDKRHIAGAVFQNKLQYHTHFPDLRALAKEHYKSCLADFFFNLQNPLPRNDRSMQAYANHRYGKVIGETIINPIIKRVQGFESNQISDMAAFTPPVDRIVLFDEPLQQGLMGCDSVRQRTAYPQQRHLPLHYASKLRSYYPKAYGMYHVTDAIRSRLEAQNIEVLTQTQLLGIKHSKHAITALTLKTDTVTRKIESIAALYWSVNMVPLAKYLDVLPQSAGIDPLFKTVLVNLVLDRLPNIKDLYHIWVLDGPYHTYRVTCFQNYCPNAFRACGGYPLCVELILDQTLMAQAGDLTGLALKELEAFGILQANTQIRFAGAETLGSGFPFPLSIKNIDFLTRARSAIRGLNIDNLNLVGILSEPNLFFQADLMSHVYHKIFREST